MAGIWQRGQRNADPSRMKIWQRLYPRKSLSIDDSTIFTNAAEQPVPRAAETSVAPAAVLFILLSGPALKYPLQRVVYYPPVVI
jgi:hypothetical protein